MKPSWSLFGIAAFLMLSIGNSAIAKPVIQWEPEKLEAAQMQGTQSIHSIKFAAAEDLEKIFVDVAPELHPWVSVSPYIVEAARKGKEVELTLTINIPPDETVGEHNGVIQIRHRNFRKGRNTIAKPLPVSLVITEKTHHSNLPPDPGEAGRETLLGIDSDLDGVRDDVQRYIYSTYPDDEKVRLALTQIAMEYQGILSDADDRDAAFRHATRMSRHGECLFYIQEELSLDTHAALKAVILNTKERSIAYIRYSDNLAGEFIIGAPVKKWKESCNFDIDAMEGNP